MKPRSMRWYLTWYLLAFTGIMALIYGLLMSVYLINGVEAEASYSPKLYAARYEERLKEDPGALPPRIWDLSGYLDRLPDKYLALFPADKHQDRKLLFSFEYPDRPRPERGDYFFFMPIRLADGRQLYVVKIHEEKYCSLFDVQRFELLYYSAIPIGILFVTVFFLTLRFILNRFSRPTEKLSAWARGLDAASLDQPVPDFGYQEPNAMAGLIHSSLQNLSKNLEKEQQFLRNASHELRTPVAVVQSNAELLTRLNPGASGPEARPVKRILKAAVNMNQLIETLLWLAKDVDREPAAEAVALDALAREVVEENRYLLEGKAVSVDLDLRPSAVTAVAHAARIALGNLVRNACQYTGQGRVLVRVAGGQVTVVNENQQPVTDQAYGSGLGLALVEQLAAKSGWAYGSLPVPGGREAWVDFSPGH